ncbi:sigma factor-like helix-turn-helix DNA-binding protein [Mesorhizobium sp. M4B.F.Ca.ET.143.01.1.1]|uniref:sigma factor-like helix-turn-helix DNA-binding protein n=1 Tax=Mesorhizobium sp. M4B.F.Ca.ET.143.01.1.1 TaxID=2563947 RepID=UPI0010933FB2|nr:sigma factor-like helix-turn-helix DNA-binding protein [Mesorhizobium sp. M4B.F.Ca.ET.143.01.1.1]TGV26356.1 hypothetical protein EN786_12605 [Mesorhizobium sp. M4B.F.Ca.ET.143.01.1.1]
MNAFQEAIKTLLVKARDEGLSKQEAADALGVNLSVLYYRSKQLGIDWPERRGRQPQSEPNERALDILARNEAGETLESIGEVYGITRERVRQIVKKFGGQSKRAMHHAALQKLADFLKEHPMTLSEAGQSLGLASSRLRDAASVGGVEFLKISLSRENELAPLAELVRQGQSINSIANGSRALAGRLRTYCNAKGIKSQAASRWSVSPLRAQVIGRLYAEGKSWAEISAAVAAVEGVRSFSGAAIYNWAALHMDLPHREPRKDRRKSPGRRPKLVAVSQGPSDIDLRETVRETALANRDKATAAQIAKACGTTRNSIIGHWFRARQSGAVA